LEQLSGGRIRKVNLSIKRERKDRIRKRGESYLCHVTRLRKLVRCRLPVIAESPCQFVKCVGELAKFVA
jgi:hypothetical protein